MSITGLTVHLHRAPHMYVIALDSPTISEPQFATLGDLGMVEGVTAYAEVEQGWQADCEHGFMAPDSYGDASCIACGVHAYSTAWVKDGVYGTDTLRWAKHREFGMADMQEAEAKALLVEQLGARAILVRDMLPGAPTTPARHRAGIAVPAMTLGHTSV